MLDYTLTKLDNGLKVITAPLKGTKAVTVLVLVKTGSRYEEKQNNGIAHFLEHMFFKGTNKRPKTVDIARELDAVGAGFNAFTGEEYTGFYVRAESSHFDLALDILTDMLFNSKFEAREIEKEKGVILEEINMIKDAPQSYVEHVMMDLLYGDQPLGRMITGTPDTVKNFNRDTFTDFYKKCYQPENIIVTVAGLDSQMWLEKIKMIFEKLPTSKPLEYLKVQEKQEKPSLKIHNKTTDQAHFLLGFRGIKRSDPRRPILRVMNNILGGTMSSRLFIEVREKRGLCYYVNSDFTDYHDTGIWEVAAGVDIKRIKEAIEVILNEFTKLKNELVTEEELKRAKENFKGHFYLSLEESMSVAEFLAEQELLWGEIKDPDEIVKENNQVTAIEIQKLAGEIMRPENMNLAVVGPFEDKKEFSELLNKFK